MTINSFLSKDECHLCTISCVECDPTFFEAFRIIFEWANQQGLNGIKASDLELIYSPAGDPLNVRKWIKCRVRDVKEILLDESDIDWSVRAYNTCKSLGVKNLSDFESISVPDLLRLGRCGKKTINEIKSHLAPFGIKLKGEP